MVQGGMKIVKFSLFAVNLLFVIAGIVMISVGVITKNGINKFGTLIKPSELNVPANLFIGVGVVVFFIAFLGCCGAVRENHCMMMTYSVLIGLLLILEIGASVTAYYLEDDVEQIVEKGLEETLSSYGDNTTAAADYRKTWDIFQHEFKCCGSANYTDWFNVHMWNESSTDFIIPNSCCKTDSEGCADLITQLTPTDKVYEVLYETGCVKRGVELINIGKIGTVGIALAVFELIAVICACFMARSIRYSYETV